MNQLKISIQPIKASKTIFSLIANISFGHKTILERHVRLPDGRPLKRTTRIVKYKPVRISTGLTIPIWAWNRKKKSAAIPYQDVNKKIEAFKNYVTTLFNSLSEANTIEVEPKQFSTLIKKHISSKFRDVELDLRRSKNKKSIDFKKLPKVVLPTYFGNDINGIPTELKNYIGYKIEKYTKEGAFNSDITTPTLKIYKRLQAMLLIFEEATGRIFDLMKINVDDVKDFISFYINRKRLDGKDYSYNYMSWVKKEFKNFINKAKLDKIPVIIEMNDPFWEITFDKQNDPYLTFAQIEKIRKRKSFSNLSEEDITLLKENFESVISGDVLDVTRDMFLVACNGGMRFVDLKKIRHIFYSESDGWYFDYVQEKTDTRVKVPVRKSYIVDMYLKKYNKEFPKVNQEQTFNEALKAVCLLSGLTEMFNVSSRDVNTKKQKPKDVILWTQITSKTGRKTFATNEVIEYHTPLIIIMSYTGHKTEKTLKTYLQLSESDYYKSSLKLSELLEKIKVLEERNRLNKN